MEVITLELKRVGAFVARQLSMKNVKCELVIAELTEQNKQLYNDCVILVSSFASVWFLIVLQNKWISLLFQWQLIYEILEAEEQRIEQERQNLQRMLREETGEKRKVPKNQCQRSHLVQLQTYEYWADHQRFFLNLLISFKSDALLRIKEYVLFYILV